MGHAAWTIASFALKATAVVVFSLTFFTGKLTFADDPSVALVACIRYVGCPQDTAQPDEGRHVRLTGLTESLPFEAGYDFLRQHGEVAVLLLVAAFILAPWARRLAMRRQGAGEQPGRARKYGPCEKIRAMTDVPDPDPMPQPPEQPDINACCGSGCDPCIFDAHDLAMDEYRQALRAWQARQGGALPSGA